MSNGVIVIEGVDTPEIDEHIRLIQAGMYDLSVENTEGWLSSIGKVFKKVVKPLTKTLSPVLKLAKVATNVPVLSNLIPGKGMIKMGLGLFDDMKKIEKSSGKKIQFSRQATKNLSSAMYMKGYKEGRADEAKEQIMRGDTSRDDETSGRNAGSSRNRRRRRRTSTRYSSRRRRRG